MWCGTKRQFAQFVDLLNTETKKYGIEFGDHSIGESVNFLDSTVYIDENGFLQYRLYKKPTDSRLYLKTHSFHPHHTFNSVAYSQLLRVSKRNSLQETADEDLKELTTDLMKSGHKLDNIIKLRDKSSQKQQESERSEKKNETTLALVLDHFQEIKELKSLVYNLKTDINTLVGKETNILVSSRRGSSIANNVIKNRKLCESDKTPSNTQKCGSSNCKSCPLMTNVGDSFSVNGAELKTPAMNYNCKTKNAIYVAQCQICGDDEENTYVGQTMQPVHRRLNGHRSCFVKDGITEEYLHAEKSALSLHNHEKHFNNMDLNNFKVMIVNNVNPCALDRREVRTIDKLRTDVLGLNRMNVQK